MKMKCRRRLARSKPFVGIAHHGLGPAPSRYDVTEPWVRPHDGLISETRGGIVEMLSLMMSVVAQVEFGRGPGELSAGGGSSCEMSA